VSLAHCVCVRVLLLLLLVLHTQWLTSEWHWQWHSHWLWVWQWSRVVGPKRQSWHPPQPLFRALWKHKNISVSPLVCLVCDTKDYTQIGSLAIWTLYTITTILDWLSFDLSHCRLRRAKALHRSCDCDLDKLEWRHIATKEKVAMLWVIRFMFIIWCFIFILL